MADIIYNNFKEELFKGSINLSSDTLKVALVTSGYTPDADAHDFFDDVTNEVTGDGYTAGGQALASKAVTQDNTDNEGVFDAADLVWENSTITARGAVLYKDTGTPSTSPLIKYFDFTTDRTSENGDFEFTFDAEGILNVT